MNNNKIRSIQWAQNFHDASDVAAVLQGAKAIEEFLNATGPSMETEQDVALSVAS